MSARNPIYQALRTSGVLEALARSYAKHPRVAALHAKVVADRTALQRLYQRGMVTPDERAAIWDRINRPHHAAVLRLARLAEPMEQRRRATKTVRRICPPGMTRYGFRMGHGHA